MSARDVIESELSKPAIDASGWTYFDMADAILAALLAAPEAVRLELARELVKAEGWRVVKVPDDVELTSRFGDDAEWISWRQGHNACRAATLASEGNGSE